MESIAKVYAAQLHKLGLTMAASTPVIRDNAISAMYVGGA
jgi:hypothetical protein